MRALDRNGGGVRRQASHIDFIPFENLEQIQPVDRAECIQPVDGGTVPLFSMSESRLSAMAKASF